MRTSGKGVVLTVVGLLLLGYLWLNDRRLSEEVEFLRARTFPHDVKRLMAWKQYYADKVWHAGRARDWQAAGWYAWQVRRMADEIVKADLVTGNGPLAKLEESIFLPAIDPLLDAMRADNAQAFEARYRDMVLACNACHAATEHAYIRIAVPGEGAGRWNQSFETSRLDW